MGLISDQLHPVLLEDFQNLREEVDAGLLHRASWLITGATGMIPAYMVIFLSWLNEVESLGMRFHLWVRSLEKAADTFPWARGQEPTFQIAAPVWNAPRDWDVPETDFVIHAASPATPAACRADPGGVRTCNVQATEALLGKANVHRLKKFLFFSSSEVYGDTAGIAFPDEGQLGHLDPESPRSLYPQAKRMGENATLAAFRERGLPVNSARIFHTYGPGMDLVRDGRVFADFVGNAVRGEDIALKSDGSGRRAFCYVSDTVGALLLMLLKGSPGESYNVGNPDGVLSVSELADLIISLVPDRGLQRRMQSTGAPQSQSAEVFPNIGKLRKLGWQPRVDPQHGFARTLQFHLQ